MARVSAGFEVVERKSRHGRRWEIEVGSFGSLQRSWVGSLLLYRGGVLIRAAERAGRLPQRLIRRSNPRCPQAPDRWRPPKGSSMNSSPVALVRRGGDARARGAPVFASGRAWAASGAVSEADRGRGPARAGSAPPARTGCRPAPGSRCRGRGAAASLPDSLCETSSCL